MNEDQKELLTEKEAAAYLRVTPRTMIKKRHLGLVPHSRFGDRVLYRKRDLDELLERNYVPAMAAVAAA